MASFRTYLVVDVKLLGGVLGEDVSGTVQRGKRSQSPSAPEVSLLPDTAALSIPRVLSLHIETCYNEGSLNLFIRALPSVSEVVFWDTYRWAG